MTEHDQRMAVIETRCEERRGALAEVKAHNDHRFQEVHAAIKDLYGRFWAAAAALITAQAVILFAFAQIYLKH